jgi:glycosyltransferase involved in cell wall biosynthesis
MKLIIQIPCFNEAGTLPLTLRDLPRQMAGVDRLEVLVIDDGSTDRTVEVARAGGVDHLIQLKSHRGLATAFKTGLNACLQLGADIIVNTDADNPFQAGDIPRLLEPILEQRADLVIGVRPRDDIRHFPPLKRSLHRLGSWALSRITRLEVPDPTSGFRAYSREAALRLNIVSDYTYVLECIMQAADKGLLIAHVPIRTNEPLRESRLIKSTPYYVLQSMMTVLRVYLLYKPLRFFFTLGSITVGLGVVAGVKFLITYWSGPGGAPVPSLVASVALLALGIQMWVCGLIGDVIAANRKLMEETLYCVRTQQLKEGTKSRVHGAS